MLLLNSDCRGQCVNHALTSIAVALTLQDISSLNADLADMKRNSALRGAGATPSSASSAGASGLTLRAAAAPTSASATPTAAPGGVEASIRARLGLQRHEREPVPAITATANDYKSGTSAAQHNSFGQSSKVLSSAAPTLGPAPAPRSTFETVASATAAAFSSTGRSGPSPAPSPAPSPPTNKSYASKYTPNPSAAVSTRVGGSGMMTATGQMPMSTTMSSAQDQAAVIAAVAATLPAGPSTSAAYAVEIQSLKKKMEDASREWNSTLAQNGKEKSALLGYSKELEGRLAEVSKKYAAVRIFVALRSMVRERQRKALVSLRDATIDTAMAQTFTVLDSERNKNRSLQVQISELQRELVASRNDNNGLSTVIADLRQIEKQHEMLLQKAAASEKVESVVAELKESHVRKVESLRDIHEGNVQKLTANFNANIAEIHRSHALEIERTRLEAEAALADTQRKHGDEVARMRALIDAAVAARQKALDDAASESRRSLSLQSSQATTSLAHLEALLNTERQQHARALEETRGEASATLAKMKVEHENAMRSMRQAHERSVDGYESQLSAAANSAQASASQFQRERDEVVSKFEQKAITRQAEHDAEIARIQTQLASARSEILDLTSRLQKTAADSKNAQMESILKLESKIASMAAGHEKAIAEVNASCQRKIALVQGERDEAVRALQREVSAAKEAGEVAVAASESRHRDALAEALAQYEAGTQALQQRMESLTAAQAREIEEVTRRLQVHADQVDADHAEAARTWRNRESQLEKEISDLKDTHAAELDAVQRDHNRENEALRAYIDALQAQHAAAMATSKAQFDQDSASREEEWRLERSNLESRVASAIAESDDRAARLNQRIDGLNSALDKQRTATADAEESGRAAAADWQSRLERAQDAAAREAQRLQNEIAKTVQAYQEAMANASAEARTALDNEKRAHDSDVRDLRAELDAERAHSIAEIERISGEWSARLRQQEESADASVRKLRADLDTAISEAVATEAAVRRAHEAELASLQRALEEQTTALKRAHIDEVEAMIRTHDNDLRRFEAASNEAIANVQREAADAKLDLTAVMEARVAELQASAASAARNNEEAITVLKRDHAIAFARAVESAVADVRAEAKAAHERLVSKHSDEVHALRTAHGEEVQALRASHDSIVAGLQAAGDRDRNQLEAALAEQAARLVAACDCLL